MERLTQKDEQGNWFIRGLRWGDTYPGAVITRNTYERIYGVSNKLLDYEDTGLAPDEINALRERNKAKAPEKVSNSSVRYTDDYICPYCGKHFTGTGIAAFCYHCGQRLKWED
jgi:hypothetical protein